MLDIFGEENFKQLIRYCKAIPGYYVPADGTGVYSSKSQRFLTSHIRYDYTSKGKKNIRCVYTKCSIPKGFFPDYTHFRSDRSNCARIRIDIHRAVMETWRPIDKYPPIPRGDWDKCPESAKQWIRDTAYVDHIDNDPTNNHVDNLAWVVPKDNQHWRKKGNHE